MKFPILLATSVIRGSKTGSSHGGAYLVDAQTGDFEKVIDWDDPDIDWSGRGGDRGLRGIAFDDKHVWMAASDELFMYDKQFNLLDSFRSPYLKHCHEIFRNGESLFLTSTGYNAVLEFDLPSRRFTNGWLLELTNIEYWLYRRGAPLLPRLRTFDPQKKLDFKLVSKNSLHLNNVYFKSGKLFTSGTRSRHIFQIQNNVVSVHSRVPFSAHNARPHEHEILLNDTSNKRAAALNRNGVFLEKYPVKSYESAKLEKASESKRVARQGFSRGLVLWNDFLFVGSSPATINVFKRGKEELERYITLSMDIRNSIHGLAVWPWR